MQMYEHILQYKHTCKYTHYRHLCTVYRTVVTINKYVYIYINIFNIF